MNKKSEKQHARLCMQCSDIQFNICRITNFSQWFSAKHSIKYIILYSTQERKEFSFLCQLSNYNMWFGGLHYLILNNKSNNKVL